MGCYQTKTIDPLACCSPIEYHPFNRPVSFVHELAGKVDVHEPHRIYEVLEYWFCSRFSDDDRTDHIKTVRMLEFDAQRLDETPQANDYHTPGFDTKRGSVKSCFGECKQQD